MALPKGMTTTIVGESKQAVETLMQNRNFIKKVLFLWKVYKMKKVNECSPFCPKSTMNLTYLCYGSSKI
ncbi:hypothetical protein [Thalassobellus sediminis]|uniref:hypothetical protein n=1 Tax=Thalassobellus sediminis TaxID=3367753 RepID=UPI0037897972